MKKLLLFSFVIAGTTAGAFGQFHVDFENLNLVQADTFYNGADNAGGFTISDLGVNAVTFSNVYTISQWGDYWNGFSYSNMTDNTTPGYGNQYSSYTGGGAGGSQIYSVFYLDGLISFQNYALVDSLKITNTTYAALSMLNGDSYGKQFGSPNNAQGVLDGTNGEDFLRLWIIAMDDQMNRTDSLEFYLADYRFSDNSQDYIVSEWENVDLSSFGFIKHLTFRFESSDMSFGYINTPTYFALDDIYFTEAAGVNDLSADPLSVYPNPVRGELHVNGLKGEITVRNPEGKILLNSTHEQQSLIDFSGFGPGVYFVSVSDGGKIYTQKIVK